MIHYYFKYFYLGLHTNATNCYFTPDGSTHTQLCPTGVGTIQWSRPGLEDPLHQDTGVKNGTAITKSCIGNKLVLPGSVQNHQITSGPVSASSGPVYQLLFIQVFYRIFYFTKK